VAVYLLAPPFCPTWYCFASRADEVVYLLAPLFCPPCYCFASPQVYNEILLFDHPSVGEAQGEGVAVSSPRKQESRLLWVCPLVSFPRRQQSRPPVAAPPCPSCVSSSPVRLSPPRERPAVPKAPPGEGATVSFLRKQEPRLLWVCPLVSFPRKQEPTQCPSCASSSPVRLSPPRERPAVPKAPPGEGATVSFPRKQQSSTPLPTARKATGAEGTTARGALLKGNLRVL
jgi:hypothetical protein